MDIQKFMDDNRAWTDKTFPGATGIGALRHMQREADETIEAIQEGRRLGALQELADCYLLLLNACSRMGFSFDSLQFMAEKKMEENRKRTWGQVNYEGFAEHIKPSE